MMSTPTPDYVTVRELYATLDARDTKTAAAIAEMRTEIVHQFETHEAHHQAEDAKRMARIRWLVGVALTVGGLAGGFAGHVIERLLG
jgi:hypothetical protein